EDSTEASSEAVVPNGEPGGPDEVVEALVSLPPITPATLVDGSLTRALLALTRDIAGLGERAVSAVDGLTAGAAVEGVTGTLRAVTEPDPEKSVVESAAT